MPQITLESLFPTAWGIAEHRREEIEKGGYSAFNRILSEEICKRFAGIKDAAVLMGVSVSTARGWLKGCDARFIDYQGKYMYFRLDCENIKQEKEDLRKAKVKLKKKP